MTFTAKITSPTVIPTGRSGRRRARIAMRMRVTINRVPFAPEFRSPGIAILALIDAGAVQDLACSTASISAIGHK